MLEVSCGMIGSTAAVRPRAWIVGQVVLMRPHPARLPGLEGVQARGREAQTTATFTEWIGGSASNRQLHSSPPSRPIQSCPVVVPK